MKNLLIFAGGKKMSKATKLAIKTGVATVKTGTNIAVKLCKGTSSGGSLRSSRRGGNRRGKRDPEGVFSGE